MRNVAKWSMAVAGAVVVLAAAPRVAHAAILNYGVDVLTDGSFTVTPFYADSDGGHVIKGGITGVKSGQTSTFTLDTKAAFKGYTINSASLFVDGVNIDSDDNAQVRLQGSLIGELKDVPHALTRVPVKAGGTKLSPVASDTDNTFFALSPALASQLATSSAYKVAFHNADFNALGRSTNDFRLEGFNFQVDATPIIPEPGSLVIFGLGSLGLAWAKRRRTTTRA